MVDERLAAAATDYSYRLLFLTISGAHLYGFPSPDSDYDLRGVHIVPIAEVLALSPIRETVTATTSRDGLQLDVVTHDLKKFATLLLKRNGYVLEQLYSPLIVHTRPEHAELKQLAQGCITRGHAAHYLGFAQTAWKQFEEATPRRVKSLLYVYRVLLTGIHLMRTGEVEANLPRLNAEAHLSHIPELIARKVQESERATLADGDVMFHAAEVARLRGVLEEASRTSGLPEEATSHEALNEFIVRVRMDAAGDS